MLLVNIHLFNFFKYLNKMYTEETGLWLYFFKGGDWLLKKQS